MYKLPISELKQIKNSLIQTNNSLIECEEILKNYKVVDLIKENQRLIELLTTKYYI
jgi:hypothetical protein